MYFLLVIIIKMNGGQELSGFSILTNHQTLLNVYRGKLSTCLEILQSDSGLNI